MFCTLIEELLLFLHGLFKLTGSQFGYYLEFSVCKCSGFGEFYFGELGVISFFRNEIMKFGSSGLLFS